MPTRRWGPEAIANTSTAGSQSGARVAALAGGGFVVVWKDHATPSPAVRARVFDALGVPLGAEITVAASSYAGSDIAVAGTAEGGFYVSWVNRNTGGSVNNVEGYVYSATGEFVRYQPAIFDAWQDANPEVARLGTGVAVLWEHVDDDGAGMRIFDGAGTGGIVHTDVLPAEVYEPEFAVAASADAARMAVVWRQANTVQAKIYNADGTAIVPATTVGTTSAMSLGEPAVAWAGQGVLAVGWREFEYGFTSYRMVMQYWRVAGFGPTSYTLASVSPANQINATLDGQRGDLVLTALPGGGVVASWTEQGSLRLQAFDGAGNRVGGEYRVTPPGESGFRPSLAALADGRVVVSWAGPNEEDEGDIHLQIIDPRQGIVVGSAGNDTLYGNDFAADEISGGTGNDTLFGMRGEDLLDGGAGNDTLDGGGGADDLYGGRGNDLFVLDQAGDAVFELAGQGNDTIRALNFNADLTRLPHVENVTLAGTTATSARGNSVANIIDGASSSGANLLVGLAGNDIYIVGAGDTISEVASGGLDTVQSATLSLDLVAYPGVENIALLGTLALKATGNIGANTIDGSQNSAANVLVGLGGNDLFIVGPGDSIVEVAGGGTDTVQSALISLNLALYPGVQNVALTGALPLSGTGDAAANVLDGTQNSTANELTGLGGDDIYLLGLGDTVTEGAGGGVDTVRSAAVSLDLQTMPNVENLALLGTEALSGTGNAAANTLDGSGNPAANFLSGGDGDDIYIIDGLDQVLEFAGKGSDTLQTGRFSLALAGIANVENATLTGALPLFATGTAEANVLNGQANSAANVLTGLDGNDIFVVGAGDTIVETPSGGEDTVQSATISLNLANYPSVEFITLTGSLPLSATGNIGLNLIDGSGNSAANALAGLTGNDVYLVGAGDTVDEPAGGGADTVFARANHTLKAGAEVEVLLNFTVGTGLSLTGNALPQRIQGNGGNDTLSAGGGGGELAGAGGTDTLIGGVGADLFMFGLNTHSVPGPLRDVILGFNGAEGDRIDLSGMDTQDLLAGDQAFTFLGTGAFTGAKGEVRFVASGPDVVVQGVQFPGVTFEIRVAGLTTLSAADFRL